MYQGSILVLTLLTVILVIVPMHASAQSENMMATIETKSGNFVIEFFPDVAPSHVNNFITLSQDGFYDGTVFHRVINGFMIQGGDPNTKDPELISLWGTGGPDHSVDAEFNDISHERGIVSMARSSNPNSAGSQFFIVHEDASFLDGQYTVFGRIVGDESFTTLDNIANMDTLPSDVPVDWQNTEIISITFEENMMSEENMRISGLSVKRQFVKLMTRNRSIYDCMKMDIINYTALAVKIQMSVERHESANQ